MNIKEYLLKENISLRELARRLGISATYLADLRDGRRKTISYKTYIKFLTTAPEININKIKKVIYKMED